MTPEETLKNLDNEDVKKALQMLRTMGCLTEPDDSKVTVELLEQACVKLYMENNSVDNQYTKRDDWTISETMTIDGQEVVCRNLTSGFTLVDGNRLPSLSNKDADGKWESVNWDGVAAVKSELMKGHGVSAGFKADQAEPGTAAPEKYMSTKTWAHYTYEDIGTSHMICIVGWDDGYAASNFLEGHQPPANGAWLVKNSWGSETDYVVNETGQHIGESAWGLEDENGKHTGYFWISYYDKSLNYCESLSFDTDLADAKGEMVTRMYDYMPSLIGVRTGEDTSMQSEDVLKTANVFKNDTGVYAQLASVSTKTASPNATVKYSVYKLTDGFKNPEDGELLGTKTATYDYAGFHREKLGDPIVLKDGETFAVVAEETVEEGGKALYECAVNAAYTKEHAEAVKAEEAAKGVSSDDRDRNADEYGVAVVNKGESFIYEDGAWTDWSEYGKRAELSGQYAIDNFSIKAYMVAKGDTCAMHRLYNPWSYEHFYTSDDEEFEGLVALGWADEGIGWVSPAESDTPVFRLYNPYNGGDHHYTKDAEERDYLVSVGWVDEEVGWYSFGDTGTPVYREYNPNELARNHNYTTDKGEHDGLVALGWHDEEIAWYGVPSNDADLQAASL